MYEHMANVHTIVHFSMAIISIYAIKNNAKQLKNVTSSVNISKDKMEKIFSRNLISLVNKNKFTIPVVCI